MQNIKHKRIYEIVPNSLAWYFVPKCGSSTIRAWMYVLQNGTAHLETGEKKPAQKMVNLYEGIPEEKIKEFNMSTFCIVRDPLERFHSAYTHLVVRKQHIGKIITIDEFVDGVEAEIKDANWIALHAHVKPLVQQIGNSPEIFSKIFNLRQMDQVKSYIEKFSNKTLPEFWLNKNKVEKYEMTEKSINFVKKKYAQDYELYGKWM